MGAPGGGAITQLRDWAKVGGGVKHKLVGARLPLDKFKNAPCSFALKIIKKRELTIVVELGEQC